MSTSGQRPIRADARRNRERLVVVAAQLFAAHGLGVPLDEIARRAGVGAGTVHRHFPTKEALYLAVATDQLDELVNAAQQFVSEIDSSALYRMLKLMITTGTGPLKSALAAAEFDLRTAAPQLAAELRHYVGVMLDRARAANMVRPDVDVDELMALVAGTLAAIRHAGAEGDVGRSDHLARIMLDGLRPASR